MKSKMFNNVAKWAAKKMVKELMTANDYWQFTSFSVNYITKILQNNFRENFKNHSRIEINMFPHNPIVFSFSFEKTGFLPSNQRDATILVFRAKRKGASKPISRIIFKIPQT